ncbi:MAG: YfhO family protein, partial [Chloroflexi bacterium]|nr:YfhO family protein [Chloroflexota bacterium]
PFAYTIDEATLDTQVASASQVAAIQPSDVTTNTMTFVASTRDNDRYLVANVVAFPGWQITVDGKPADLVTVGGYVGVKLRPGVHTYRFSYATLGLRTGLILSGGAILVCLLWGIGVTVGPLVRSLTWLENRVRRYRQQKKGADNKNEQPGHLLLGHDS